MKCWGTLELIVEGDEQLAKEIRMGGHRVDLRRNTVVCWRPSKDDVLRRMMGSPCPGLQEGQGRPG